MSKRSFQKSVDGESILVPKDLMEAAPIQLTAKAMKALQPPREKRVLSELQRANLDKLVAANKERKKIRDEQKAELATPAIIEEEKKFQEEIKPVKKEIKREKLVEDEREKLASGNFIKVVIQKKTRAKRMKLPVTTTEDETTETETETDTDVEEYKTKARAVRRAVTAKKLVKTVEKIDRVIQQAAPAPVNPYAHMLASRWR